MAATPHDLKTYRRNLKQALDNHFLRNTLNTFATAYPEARRKAFQGLDFEALRDHIARTKDRALPHLERLLETFQFHAERAGARVHLAQTAREANEIIASIGAANGVRRIVKSKSMTAEETLLNSHLESEGFRVTETDLGEWIIQLRGEGPSHMVLPAIHLSRHQVAELFSGVAGRSLDPDDIDALVKVARRQLRQAFLEADMGISGANFAVATSGTLGILTNEGNGRLVTTLPRVHVALVGIDKLVPDLEAALRILQVLPKNATGQAISSYVTWITGANECGPSPSGRKQMHIVFLDNGRLALARDPVLSQVLRCVRCGACANVCPAYRLVGGHNYGHIYIGAIGLILTYLYHGKNNARAIVHNCLNCQACKEVCPAGIDLPHLIKTVHRLILEDEGRRPLKNRLLALVMKDRRLFHGLLRRARILQQPLVEKNGMVRHLPLFFSKEHQFRSLPALAAKPLRERWRAPSRGVSEPRFRVALFAGCVIDFVYPEQAEALRLLLDRCRVRLDFPAAQACCGLPAMMVGEHDLARDIALQNIEALQPGGYDHILTLCASCGSHLKENYPKLLADRPRAGTHLASLLGRVTDYSSFVTRVLGVTPELFRGSGRKVAYHAPCHLCRGLKVTHEPRQLLQTAGLNYVPAAEEDVCCGFGGSYSLEFPEMSAAILQHKLENTQNTGAGLLVTDCPGCVLQLRGGVDKGGLGIEVRHIAEVIAEELC